MNKVKMNWLAGVLVLVLACTGVTFGSVVATQDVVGYGGAYWQGSAGVLAADDLSIITNSSVIGGNVKAVGWQSSGDIVYATDAASGYLYVCNGTDVMAAKHSVFLGVSLNAMAVLSDDRIVIGLSNGWMYVLTPELAVQSSLNTTATINDIAVDANDNIAIATNYYLGQCAVLDSSLNVLSVNSSFNGNVTAVDFLSNGNVVVGTDYAGGYVYTMAPDNLTAALSMIFIGTTTTDIAVQSDDDVVVGTNLGQLALLDSTLNIKSLNNGMGGAITSLAVQSDDDIVYASLLSLGTIGIADADDTNVILASLVAGGTVNDVAVYNVPEPTTMALLGLGGLVTLIRRKK